MNGESYFKRLLSAPPKELSRPVLTPAVVRSMSVDGQQRRCPDHQATPWAGRLPQTMHGQCPAVVDGALEAGRAIKS